MVNVSMFEYHPGNEIVINCRKSSERSTLIVIIRVGYILVYARILINHRIYNENRMFYLKQDKIYL